MAKASSSSKSSGSSKTSSSSGVKKATPPPVKPKNVDKVDFGKPKPQADAGVYHKPRLIAAATGRDPEPPKPQADAGVYHKPRLIAAATGRDPEPPKPKKTEPPKPVPPKSKNVDKRTEKEKQQEIDDGLHLVAVQQRVQAREEMPGLIRQANEAHRQLTLAVNEFHTANQMYRVELEKFKQVNTPEKIANDTLSAAFSGFSTGSGAATTVLSKIPGGQTILPFAAPIAGDVGAIINMARHSGLDTTGLDIARDAAEKAHAKAEKASRIFAAADHQLTICIVNASKSKLSIDNINVQYPTSVANLQIEYNL